MVLRITVSSGEQFDEEKKQFVKVDPEVLEFEHSLVSLSKWESKYEKPFLSNDEKTEEEMFGYLECMLLDDSHKDRIRLLDSSQIREIEKYIRAKMTATWFSETKEKGSKEIITAEILYYWMIALTIPWEAQYWHLNRLITLVKVCNEKNAPKKNLSKAEIAARNRRLNEERRAKYKTKG